MGFHCRCGRAAVSLTAKPLTGMETKQSRSAHDAVSDALLLPATSGVRSHDLVRFGGLGAVVGEVDPNGNMTSSAQYDVYGAKRAGGTGTATMGVLAARPCDASCLTRRLPRGLRLQRCFGEASPIPKQQGKARNIEKQRPQAEPLIQHFVQQAGRMRNNACEG